MAQLAVRPTTTGRAQHRRPTWVPLMAGLSLAVLLGAAVPAGAQDVSTTPAVAHQVTATYTSVATFVGAAVLPGDGPTRTAIVTNWGQFSEVVSQPSPALFLGAYTYFENGGFMLRVVGTTDESPLTLVTAMDGLATDIPPYTSGDTWVVPALGSFSGSDYDRVTTALVAVADRNIGIALLEPPSVVVDRAVAADDTAPLTGLADHLRSVLPSDQWASAALYGNRFTLPAAVPGLAISAGTAVPLAAAMAGVYAETDVTRGVWKAPAGLQTSLEGIVDEATMAFFLTDQQTGELNVAGVDSMRSFPGSGVVAWGARTLAGTDLLGSPYKYISPVRLSHFIRRSLQGSLVWAVFEPNDEALWAAVEVEVTVFLQGLFTQGAFVGAGPAQAYDVHVDATTTTPEDVAAGRVNVQVGFAPVDPAEFIMLTITLTAGPR